tara:strand:- start:19 stop:900 length:882 start_codon:yes stop_codon:yes gene_type:complete
MPPTNQLRHAYWLGGAFALAAAFSFSLQDALVKWLSSDYALLQLLLVRSAIMVPTFALICLTRWGHHGLVTRRPGAHLLRAAFNLIAFLSYYYAISRMPLVDALSIASAYPIILILLSGIVLAEIPNARQIMAILAGFVGVLFIIQPTGDHVDWIGAGAALFGCLGFAGLAVHTRYLSKTESSELMLLTGASCILVLSLISAPFTWQTPTVNDLVLMLGLSVAGLFGQYGLTSSFRYAPVYLVGSLEYTALVWAALWGYLLFNDIPTLTVMAGAALVVASGLAVVLSERKKPA